MSDLVLADLGLVDEQSSTLPAEHAQMLAATLDVPFATTQPLPLLWHWAFFNPIVRTSDLGLDGHPRRDSPLLVDFPRRMWVGGDVRGNRPLRVDIPAVRRTRLVDHKRKRGSTGELLIVTLEHTIEQDREAAIVERQDVIYRQAGGVTPAEGPEVDPAPAAGWRETIHPTTTLLLRFSAVTFNSHRIHYDREYATGTEHYPGLVVHGPLTAMLLAESASSHLGKALRSFTYRASSPLFVDRPIYIDGEFTADHEGDATAELTATRADGVVGMTATAVTAGMPPPT
jgi:hydroxyacyl-ACP dehydratase HTD2-like protein with hotdog domain